MKRLLKGASIGVAAVVLSTVAINASDIARGISGSLVGSVPAASGPCGDYAVLFQFGSHSMCVDQYEASPGEDCQHKDPQNQLQTIDNLEQGACMAATVVGVTPWRFVTLNEAQQLCARAGKRLLSSEEWYRIALGTGEITNCNLSSGEVMKSGAAECITASDIHDMVGNVWEWTDEVIHDGSHDGFPIPTAGYVAAVNNVGTVIETSPEPNRSFGSDYAWTTSVGTSGMIRGGYYDVDEDGGVYAQNLAIPLDLRAPGVGFRCARDV